ncbi:MAG: transglutaminase domain-containing protein [Planctomycetes bacterium]|nr:transglutaminase domain-containing protein [Planctomycetota bacterium]
MLSVSGGVRRGAVTRGGIFRVMAWAFWPVVACCFIESVAFAQPAEVAPADLKDFEESWQVIYIGNSRVGYVRGSSGRLERDGQEVVITDSEMSTTISRFKQTLKSKVLTHSEEAPSGDLLAFRFEMLNPPAAPTRSSGRVVDGKLLLTTETNGKSTTKELKWDNTVKSPAFQDRLLRENPLKPGDKRVFESFDPQFGKRNTVTLKAGDYETVTLLGGKTQKLLAVTISQSVAPLITATEYLDDKGVGLKSTVSLANMITYSVSREEALKALTGEEVDLAVSTLVKVKPIDRARNSLEAVYRISVAGDDPAKALTTGNTQAITRVTPHVIDLTVTSVRPPEQAPPEAADQPGAEFLASNEYIQTDDALVQKHAAEAVGEETDPWKQAQLMEKWVADNLKNKNFSTLLASAAEVAKTLSGDCTEHAVLLAAMCRTQQIPSRVAVGLVYVPTLSSFGGHMWTEVYIRGVWVPLDATLGRGVVAADHIKFADTSFSDEGEATAVTSFLPLVSALGKMKIEVQSVKYPPK